MNERITVTLTPRSQTVLENLLTETGMSKTDLVNRALQMYAFIEGVQINGARVVVEWPNGEADVVKFL